MVSGEDFPTESIDFWCSHYPLVHRVGSTEIDEATKQRSTIFDR